MKISRRDWFVVGSGAATMAGLLVAGAPATTAAAEADPAGKLTEESLGNMLEAMGLVLKKEEQRYDFNFKAIYQGNEWELSMSTVLSQNGDSIWVMAWLDELPRSAADVPRTALLRLLSLNDNLGQGKFFAYIASNRRFVLQRVVANEGLSTAGFRDILQDLGTSVVESYPHWSVANWKASDTSTAAGSTNSNSKSGTAGSPGSANTTRQVPTNTAVRDSKFQEGPRRQ